ncbi:MAG: hypothetical protein K0S45_3111 [Nitrospira sp.]|nr:hypothetical protein [Nitrospira sp.]
MSSDFDRGQLVNIFVAEARDDMALFWKALHAEEKSFPEPTEICEYHTVGHKLKGAALLYGFAGLGQLGGLLEETLEHCQDIPAERWPTFLVLIRDVVTSFRSQIEEIGRGGGEDASVVEDFVRRCAALMRPGSSEGSETQCESAEECASPFAMVVDNPAAQPADSPDSNVLTDDYLIPSLDPEVMSYFAPEAQEYLETLEAHLLRLDQHAAEPETIHALFRTAHTLKGSAYTVGFKAIGDLTHHIEDFMGSVREGQRRILPGHTDLMLRAIDVIRALMRRDPSVLLLTRERFAASLREVKQLSDADHETGARSPAEPSSLETAEVADAKQTHESEPARGEGKGETDRAVIRVSRDRLERLLNLVGELVIDRGRLEQRLRTLDQLASQVLANKSRLIDAIRTFEDKHTFSFQPSSTSSGQVALEPVPGISDFGSLEFDKYDDFNILARRISEVTADITESMSQLSGSIHRAQDDMGQLQQLTLGMRDEIARARMVPIGTPFTRFRRAAREMARATGKEVNLITSGEQTEIDTGVVERLVDPLVHLVRNAVYHGIEPAGVRLSQGKPSAGTIYLHAAHRGNSVVIEVEDDGAGLDIVKIKEKAVALGLIKGTVAESLPASEVVKFIFRPGFSTAEAVGDQAGRGVGMDVVKRVIEAMNGHIEVESVRGEGTKFTMHLPLTLLIATALLVRVDKERYAIPLPSVREVTMSNDSMIQKMGHRSVLQVGDEAIEVFPLANLIRRESGIVDGATPVVIVRTSTGPLGCAVDELLGRQEIVIKSLGGLKPFERSMFGGATIDPEGRVVLVLDVSRLTARESHEAMPAGQDDVAPAMLNAPVHTAGSQTSSQNLPLLLIDDSLSIRKFVGRMLEAAGYTVETAMDGEEGCRKASMRNYQLIITDLEMPKLNGYEVIQALRARRQTQTTPILVMTTRAGEKHRQMAVNVGASGYISKPVEERALIQEIQKWTGHEAAVPK